ncbi:MAG: RNA polymerase sigma-70 factor [Bacteroidales bacterium]|nr:RNA polymerase sigma-70 factor [Bacteroidales bacterium]
MIKKNFIFEQLLIEKLKCGDPDSFSDIFSAYYKDLVFFAYTFTRELPGAEDIVQDTFVKLWEDHEKLNVTVSLKSILLKTIQNKCIDWHRHKRIVNNHSTYIIDNTPLYEYDTDNYVLRSELEGRIEKAIANLPEKFKEAFEMNRFEGLKYKEIATKLNVSIRTVEVRISKALGLLRKSLVDFL